MTETSGTAGTPPKRRHGWLLPSLVFVGTMAVSATAFFYFFSPGPEVVTEQPAPTDSGDVVEFSIAATHFHVPANYILMASARRGGAQPQVAMAAMLPGLDGYSLGAAPEFTGNAPDSRIVSMTLREDINGLPDIERLDRVYLPQVESREGTEAPFELTRYTFRADTGYRNEELFVGETEAGPVLLRCTIQRPDIPSPNCLRDIVLGGGISLNYRFKRSHLAQWRDIDSGIRALIGAFTVNR